MAMTALLVILTVLGALTISGGVALAYLPAGVITAGLLMVAGAYVIAYMRAKQ